ncbi:MAG: efflux RND transporter periplasmic adaptor subunit [Chitinophagales bacterium]|nr:efflux RND transporter periplasmic adaptor subunit [Chitinophagales bacterium]
MHAVGIQLGTVENKELTATIKANGMLKVPNNFKANATSLYGGVVKSIIVQVGDNVKAGQPIATLVNPQFIQLQEEYLSLANKITLAEQELNRQKDLNEGGAGALKNLQSITADVQTLRVRKAALQQQFQIMGIQPEKLSAESISSVLKVPSPINGVISNVFSKIGSYVDVASPVAEIVDNGSLHLDLQVFEKDLPLLKVGQIIHFTLTNNPTNEYDAEVFSIGAAFENESKTIPVHAKVKGNKNGLIDGMNITGIVSLNSATTPAVPSTAIVDANGKSYVFILANASTQPAIATHAHDGEAHTHEEKQHSTEPKESITFEKIEVVKGVSDMGYTAVTFVKDIPADAKIATQGAFFILAKMNNTGTHTHQH